MIVKKKTLLGAYYANKQYKRLWINSLESDVIRSGFQHLKDGLDYIPYYQEARARQISDWLIGMNGSPLYSLCLKKRGINGVFSLGRVQTPTLFMVYKRQVDIEQFVKTPFWQIEGYHTAQKGTFTGQLVPNQHFQTEEAALQFVSANQCHIGEQNGQIVKVEKNTKKKNSPILFSLSGLQSKVNQLYKVSASDTLKAVQKLYEAKLLSYPRTDTPYITENEFAYLKNNLDSYLSFLGFDTIQTPQMQPRARYVNGNKVQEHHAIIVTKRTPSATNFAKLSQLEKQVYLLVAKTTIAMFLPDYQYEETVIQTKVNKLFFQTKGMRPLNLGWKTLFQSQEDKKEEPLLPLVYEGERVHTDIQVIQKETQPPKAFTEGTLITAMKTAGKTLDDEEAQKILSEVEGIGTEATRASIIETLKKKEYIQVQKNNIFVTDKGKILCQAVSNQSLFTSAEMTARWETYLKKIGQKQGTEEKFIANIEKFILHLIESVPNDINQLQVEDYQYVENKKSKKKKLGECPLCSKGIVVDKGKLYGCSQYPKCSFTLPKTWSKKKLTEKNIQDLLAKGKTTKIKGFISKKDVKFDAVLELKNGKLSFDF